MKKYGENSRGVEQTSAKSQENLQIRTTQRRPESAYSIPGSMANDNWTGFTSHPVFPAPLKGGHPNLGFRISSTFGSRILNPARILAEYFK